MKTFLFYARFTMMCFTGISPPANKLKEQFRDIYYYTTPAGYEIDFYLPKKGG